MSAKAVMPLETYRLAKYAVQVPCAVCGSGNAFDAELCRYCFAPMPLVNQASDSQSKPRLIATVGSSGAGKTVYLGMLIDMLSRNSGTMQMIARGAFSINLQQRTMGALSRCEFPEKTPSEPDRWNWVHGQLRTEANGSDFNLIMPDMAGEAIMEEIDHPNTFPVVRAMFEKSAGLLLLIDTIRIEEGTDEQDFFVMKILSYVAEVFSGQVEEVKKRGRKKAPPAPTSPTVALVFTKADQCEDCFHDPWGYAKKHTPGAFQVCQERFPVHHFFASGVAGACASRNSVGNVPQIVPLRIEPRGIIEPFRWLVEKTAP